MEKSYIYVITKDVGGEKFVPVAGYSHPLKAMELSVYIMGHDDISYHANGEEVNKTNAKNALECRNVVTIISRDPDQLRIQIHPVRDHDLRYDS